TGEIVEDLALTTSLIEEGHAPVLDLGSLIQSELARSEAGAAIQRARWEFGSMRLALRRAGALLRLGLSGDRRSLLLALDLMVPPLTVFGALILAGATLSLPFAFAGHSSALRLFCGAGLLATASIMTAWLAYGRSVLPPNTLAGLGDYLIRKIRVYFGEGRNPPSAGRERIAVTINHESGFCRHWSQ
ncbi:MAG: hypothetical protein HC774_03675, partial [Sphingomonadales bacterium]|nr:hypothetical protein [Sphingomonadales bacterium]